jgi:hypothetical protein
VDAFLDPWPSETRRSPSDVPDLDKVKLINTEANEASTSMMIQSLASPTAMC